MITSKNIGKLLENIKNSKKNEKSTEAKTIIAKTLLNRFIFKNLSIYEKYKN